MAPSRSPAFVAALLIAPLILVLACSALVAAAPSVPHLLFVDEPKEKPGSTTFWTKLALSATLVILGGAFAGLTIGLMGLDPLHLSVLASAADDPKEKRDAEKVLALMAKGKHWVLVTLLIGNVIVNESLPIFLDSAIGGGIAAILISTTFIVIFGEIIPQAVCARYGLAVGARSSPFVLGLMYITSPLTYPIAKLLDYVLGKEETTTYKKAELRSFLQFHRNPNSSLSRYVKSDLENPPLNDEEIGILNGVLSLSEKKVTDIMTPMEDVVTLNAEDLLDRDLVDKIFLSGYSRYPVHEPNNPLAFIGFLLVKRLLPYDPSTPKKVGQMKLTVLPEAKPNISCFQALDYFQTGRAHLLLVSETPGKPGGALGVVTLEDIIEEIISEEIVDETDLYEDMHTKHRPKRQSTAAVMRGIVESARLRRRNSGGTSAPGTPFLGPSFPLSSTPVQNGLLMSGAGETTRLLTPIDETASGSGGSNDGKSPELKSESPKGYGATG